ncbi:Uncharacterised protein [Bordetella pertussis]|nr:Uncharacterised protein [Bordetella pertussis]
MVNSASFRPLRWMTVLMPTVVPCVKYVICSGWMP